MKGLKQEHILFIGLGVLGSALLVYSEWDKIKKWFSSDTTNKASGSEETKDKEKDKEENTAKNRNGGIGFPYPEYDLPQIIIVRVPNPNTNTQPPIIPPTQPPTIPPIIPSRTSPQFPSQSTPTIPTIGNNVADGTRDDIKRWRYGFNIIENKRMKKLEFPKRKIMSDAEIIAIVKGVFDKTKAYFTTETVWVGLQGGDVCFDVTSSGAKAHAQHGVEDANLVSTIKFYLV